MPSLPATSSLLDLSGISRDRLERLFSRANSLSSSPKQFSSSVALLFFEPSTRTRMSFEVACVRLGIWPLIFTGGSQTSMEKGETIEDTVLNIQAMGSDVLVIRAGPHVDLYDLQSKVPVPIISAGWGLKSHPTQALLDTFTLQDQETRLNGYRLLIVGDIRHSRVAHSHFELSQHTGVEIGLCGPAPWLPTQSHLRSFDSIEDGLRWCDGVMMLRVQFERHQVSETGTFDPELFRKKYALTHDKLALLKKNAMILHPGPVNFGIELDREILSDPRCRIYQQVANGVRVRQALLEMFSEGEW